jgi:hypothetical protein
VTARERLSPVTPKTHLLVAIWFFFFTIRPARRQQEECTHLLVATWFSFLLSDQTAGSRKNAHTCWLQPDFLFYYQTSPPTTGGIHTPVGCNLIFFFTIKPARR